MALACGGAGRLQADCCPAAEQGAPDDPPAGTLGNSREDQSQIFLYSQVIS